MRHRCQRRSAFVAVVLLVCLAVCGALAATMIENAAARRSSLAQQVQRSQAAWLAESALDRAAAKLRAQPDYAGEIWRPTVANREGAVTIEVAKGDQDDRRRVSVVALFPANTPRQARFTKQIVVAIKPATDDGP